MSCLELFEFNIELTSSCCVKPTCRQCLSEWAGGCPYCLIQDPVKIDFNPDQYIIKQLIKVGDEYLSHFRRLKADLNRGLNNTTQVYFQMTDFYYKQAEAPNKDTQISNIKNIQIHIEALQQLLDMVGGNLGLIQQIPVIRSVDMLTRIMYRIELNSERRIPTSPGYNHGMYQWLKAPVKIKMQNNENLVIIDKQGIGHEKRVLTNKVRLWFNSENSINLPENDVNMVSISYYNDISIITCDVTYGYQYCEITENGIKRKLASINGYYIPLGDKIITIVSVTDKTSIINLLDLKGQIVNNRHVVDINFSTIFNDKNISILVNKQDIYLYNRDKNIVVYIHNQNSNYEILELNSVYRDSNILYLDHKRDIIVTNIRQSIQICSLTNPNIIFDYYTPKCYEIPYIVDEKLHLVE